MIGLAERLRLIEDAGLSRLDMHPIALLGHRLCEPTIRYNDIRTNRYGTSTRNASNTALEKLSVLALPPRSGV